LQSLPDWSVMDRAAHTSTRVSRSASSSSRITLSPASSTKSLFTARMGVMTFSRCSPRTSPPFSGGWA
jgi:hypothetical protein